MMCGRKDNVTDWVFHASAERETIDRSRGGDLAGGSLFSFVHSDDIGDAETQRSSW